jgi:hypothetical protein
MYYKEEMGQTSSTHEKGENFMLSFNGEIRKVTSLCLTN